jgi:glycosyltransferase involved in cell wall biosynthesis
MSGEPRRRRVLFVHDDDPSAPLSSFFAQDIAALRRHFEVEVVSLHPYKRSHLEALASPRMWLSVARCNALFAWFGFSAPAVMMAFALRKPSIVIAGGSDVVYVPEIGYGLDPQRKLRRRLVLLGYRLAHRILLSSRASHRDFLKLQPSSAGKAQALYLGVDSEAFKPAGVKGAHVLSVSYITPMSIKRKGILTLLEAARRTPDIPYRIAGMVASQAAVQQILDGAPPNVAFLGYLDDQQLLREMQAARVYAQLSYHEGFGMAVAEAMACECVPVVTDSGSLPEVVGDAGLFVPVEDPDAAARAFRSAMAAGEERGKRARARVIELFRPATREHALRAILDEVMA